MDLESTPASLEATHSYTAVSSTVGAITTREPDDSNLQIIKKVKLVSTYDNSKNWTVLSSEIVMLLN